AAGSPPSCVQPRATRASARRAGGFTGASTTVSRARFRGASQLGRAARQPLWSPSMHTASPAVLSLALLIPACAEPPVAPAPAPASVPVPAETAATSPPPLTLVPSLAQEPAPGPALLPEAPAAPPKPHSLRLPSGYYNPMPGGVFAGYKGDTGLDIG